VTYSALDLVRRTRQLYLAQGRVEQRNRLQGDVTIDATSIVLRYALGNIVSNTLVSVGFEDMYVWEANTTGLSAVVERGYEGSTAAEHDDGDLVRVNPRWSDATILAALNAVLSSAWGERLYRTAAEELTFSSTAYGYPLPLGDEKIVYRVEARDQQTDDWAPIHGWRVQRDMPASTFPTGVGLFLRSGGGIDGLPLRVHYRGPFAPIVATTADVETTSGWPEVDRELLEMSAAIVLLNGRETGRNFHETQGGTRRAQEVPQGAEVQSMRPLLSRRPQLLAAAQRRLARLYPTQRER
jgi:hypothetical protein